MKKLLCHVVQVLSPLLVLVPIGHAGAAPFTAGNLAILRVGDGTALTNNATAAFIDEYTSGGTLVQSIPIPATGATSLTVSGTATSEGALMRAPNGALLCFAGYRAPAGTASIATTLSSAFPRAAGTMDASGTFAVAAATSTQFSGSNIRSGATDGAGNFWGGGNGNAAATSGVNYLGTMSPPSQVLSGNLRWVNIFNGNLYFSSGSTAPGAGIHRFTGTPVIAAASTPVAIGVGQSPYGFAINPPETIMYVADDRTIANGGGIQRWDQTGGTWTLAYTLGTVGASTVGTRGVVVDWSGTAPVVYATTTETSFNRLIIVKDTGAGSPATLLASAGANRVFRSVAFAPIVPRVPSPRFFLSDKLPPANGVDIGAGSPFATFANGVIIRNFSHREFSQGLVPPPPGGAQIHSYDSTVEMDLSADGGATFQHIAAPATANLLVTHTADHGATRFFDTEMLKLDIGGGGLPAGLMIRESPTRQSTGALTLTSETGGFSIDSFFDIFTEISPDGGQTWSPAATPGRAELGIDPRRVAPISTPTALLPPPNAGYRSTMPPYLAFPTGVVIRRMTHHFFTQSLPAPELGLVQTHHFDATVDVEVSIDGGVTFAPFRCPATVTMRVNHTRDEGATRIFDTETLQFTLQGGDLPGGLRLRECPTKPSLGGIAMTPQPDGTWQISSFFDIFTELSVDGGANWALATSGPGHAELQCAAPEVVETSPNQPPLADQYEGGADTGPSFAAGVVMKGLKLDRFTQSQPPPPPGGSQAHTFGARLRFQISTDGGLTFNPASVPAQCGFQMTSSTNDGGTRYFDTEMLTLDLTGGTLPTGVRLRESPTKASLGRTSIRELTPDAMVSSFFDVFFELTVDGGQTWQPSSAGPAEIVLAKAPPTPPATTPHFFTSNRLPPANGVDVSTPGSPFATYATGIVIRNVSHKRFTQSLPPPPSGGTQIHAFGSTVEMDLSTDGGLTFHHHAAPATVSMRVTHTSTSGGTSYYDTEMLQLDLTGGDLPAALMLRENPIKASTGKLTIEPAGGGYMIASFFDIFTEISLDNGATWVPSTTIGHVELTVDPTLIAPITAPTTLLPPPNDRYASADSWYALYASGIILRNVKHHLFTQALPAPALGLSQTLTCNAQTDLEISTDAGAIFRPARAPSVVSIRITHTRDEGTTQIFDTEMLQLDLGGGDLGGIRVRENPTQPSLGGIAITPDPNGTFRISSFFDIFTEVSVDGGQAWSPAQSPAHVELQAAAPEVAEATPNLLPAPDEYIGIAEIDAAYAPGVVIKKLVIERFTQSQPPPPPGGSQIQTFATQARFMLSTDGGVSFNPTTAIGYVSLRVTSLHAQDGTRYFDTEMLTLDLTGDTLPPNVMLRESPSQASRGRTSIRSFGAAFMVSSFFDIFFELSMDGGATWLPSRVGPAEVMLHQADPDSDHDGLPDTWELIYFGNLTHGPNEDADGDGATNLGESIAGTNPTDPASVLRLFIDRVGDHPRLRFPTVAGRLYLILSNTDLGPVWLPVWSAIAGDGTEKSIILEEGFTDPRRFYRVEVQPIR